MLPLKTYLRNPRLLFSSTLRNYGSWIPDKWYLMMLYHLETGNQLHLKDPQTFGEKIQWLKLYDRRPEYTTMVDKYAVKDYVANIIGRDYIIPTLDAWDRPEDIDLEKLPPQFVLKTTHGGGSQGVIICKNKDHLSKEQTIRRLKRAYKQNLYKESREWPYKNVQKRIMAEQYLEDEDGKLVDYKVLCFSGEAKLIEYHANRFSSHHTQDFYDIHWNKTDMSQGGQYTVSDSIADKPVCLEKMIELSEVLAKDIPTCRIDWYIVKNKLIFGEITFFDAGGFEPFDREIDEEMLGSWIHLPLFH